MSLGGAVTDGRMGGARREGGLQLLWGRDQTPSALSLPPPSLLPVWRAAGGHEGERARREARCTRL